MDAVSIDEAAAQLSQLVARAEQGEEVIVRRGSKPVAKVVAYEEPKRREPRRLGGYEGRIWIADDFDELGPEWDEYVK